MTKKDIRTSGFSLSKGTTLKGDDFYDVKIIGDLTIAIVCDGVGSATEGAAAAKRVTNHLMTNFKNRPISWSIEKSIKTFVESINAILYAESMENYESTELVTTLTIAVIQGNKLYGANVGDSRVYLKRDNILTQLSLDHAMDEEGYENVLTQAMGLAPTVDIYYFENIVKKDDKILLCSDGLTAVMDDEQIKEHIDLGANLLIKKASQMCEDDLPDDTTAVIVEILQENQVAKLKSQDLKIPEHLSVGDEIDGYILEKSLIQNDRTWLCDKKGQKYVLKFALYEAIEDETLLDAFVKEAWNSKRLKAGFFPKAVIPKNRTMRYYVMEAIDGVDLKTYLTKRKLYIDDAILMAKTVLKMSQYLLKFDLVHADIKPENIMVIERNGKHIFKIIDFGSMTEIYSISSTAGTPSYIAPERFEGHSINEGSEIFALGVTLYESLTGKFPYGEIEPFQNPTFKDVKFPKSLNANIPLWLEAVMLRSISIDPAKRYEHYSEMMFELENSSKVKPYFDNTKPLFQRDPLLTCKVGFFFMLAVNIAILVWK
jgi:serine/threonine protein phosphatase PrpC